MVAPSAQQRARGIPDILLHDCPDHVVGEAGRRVSGGDQEFGSVKHVQRVRDHCFAVVAHVQQQFMRYLVANQ